MLIKDAYVFINIDGEDVLAGRVQHVRESRGERYFFAYGRSFLTRDDAFSIDPRQLPLSEGVKVFEALPLAFQDAGPDDYGRYLYEVFHGRRPDSPLDFLVDNGNASIGALSFSTHQRGPELSGAVAATSLEALAVAIGRLEAKKPVDDAMRRLIEPGTSLPGARPKALVVDGEGEQWIAKFSRPNDLFNIPIAEFAAMTAAAEMIDAAPVRLERVGNHTIFLTRRFDRNTRHRRHFLSAYTLLGADQVTPANFYQNFGYPAIAQLIKGISERPREDAQELYRRLALNVMLGNRDDHLKNHGFLKVHGKNLYRLSPAYDIVPGAGGTAHAIGLNSSTATATLPVLTETAAHFGIEPDEAERIIELGSSVVDKALSLAKKAGMNYNELRLLELGTMTYSGKSISRRRSSAQ
jgi:serine/threonine-protein kinase HipA